MTGVLFVLAAGAGAAVRHTVNRAGLGWVGTMAVNVVGSFLLGWLIATDPTTEVATVVGTGLLGSFTTFSTFALEAIEADGLRRFVIVGGSIAMGFGGAALGGALA